MSKSSFYENKLGLYIIPSLIGMSLFYFVPALISVYHAFTDVAGRFVFLANFIDIITNSVFQLALRNTVLFIIASVLVTMAFAFMLASLLQRLRYKKALAMIFMIPLVIPSGATVFFWQVIFGDNGFINRLLFLRGMETTFWFATNWTFLIVLLVFAVRHIGFNLILFMAGYSLIPNEYYEIARLEGAGAFAIFRKVTFVYMMNTTFFVLVISIVNSFRIFRETYLLFGQHPHRSVYFLQNFMNAQFLSANMQRLSTTAFMISVGVMVMVWGIFTSRRRIAKIYN